MRAWARYLSGFSASRRVVHRIIHFVVLITRCRTPKCVVICLWHCCSICGFEATESFIVARGWIFYTVNTISKYQYIARSEQRKLACYMQERHLIDCVVKFHIWIINGVRNFNFLSPRAREFDFAQVDKACRRNILQQYNQYNLLYFVTKCSGKLR